MLLAAVFQGARPYSLVQVGQWQSLAYSINTIEILQFHKRCAVSITPNFFFFLYKWYWKTKIKIPQKLHLGPFWTIDGLFNPVSQESWLKHSCAKHVYWPTFWAWLYKKGIEKAVEGDQKMCKGMSWTWKLQIYKLFTLPRKTNTKSRKTKHRVADFVNQISGK